MRQRLRITGWYILGLSLVAASVILIVGAVKAHGDSAFNRWVGWATVLAVPVAAIGVLLVVWDKISKSSSSPKMSIQETEEELAAVVLAQAQVIRSRLLGTDEVNDRAANIHFTKDPAYLREVGGTTSGDLNSVLDYYQSLSPSRLAILGDAGAGKTVLAMDLLIRLLEKRTEDKSIPVPLLISASSYDDRYPWEDWLAQDIAVRFNLSEDNATKLVRDSRILPIVDGIDEMDPPGERKRAHDLITALNSWMRGRGRASVVVTCRRGDYAHLTRVLDRATHIEIVPLTGYQAADYLREQFMSEDENRRWTRVLAELRANPSGLLASQMSTPWRLTLALAAFRDDGDPARLLPEESPAPDASPLMYAHYVDSLLLGSYINSAVRLNDPNHRYSVAQVHDWLTALAQGLSWQGRHNRSWTDIQPGNWWRPAGNHLVHLLHFVLSAIPGLIFIALGIEFKDSLFTVVGSLSFLLACVFTFYIPSDSRLNLQAAFTGSGQAKFARSALYGVPVGAIMGFLAGFGVSPVRGFYAAVATTLAFGALAGVAIGLEEVSPQSITPLDLIKEDGRYGLVCRILGAITLTIALGIPFGMINGVVFGIVPSLTITLAFAANGWVRYRICVIVMSLRHKGPLRFGSFLDWAQQAGLLRVSGVSYQFRHRQLQDWLVSHQ
jgi:hypothetical protein